MRLLTWILLLVQLNAHLLTPCVQEVDVYDRNGNIIDDINTVVEYVHQVALGHKDNTPEDEDKGRCGLSTALKMPVYCVISKECAQIPVKPTAIPLAKRSYPSLPDPGLLHRSTDILTPPPDNLLA